MSKTSCADCNTNNRRIGSRCWVCYIRWSGRKYQVAKKPWWTARFDIIQAALRGRFEMLALGQEQDDIEKTFRFIWPHRKGVVRPHWLWEKNNKSRLAMLRIVANIERHARREHEAATRREAD